MDYLRPIPYKILKMVHCFYNKYAKEPKTLALEPKRAKKEPKRANFLKFNYGVKHLYTICIDKDTAIQKVNKKNEIFKQKNYIVIIFTTNSNKHRILLYVVTINNIMYVNKNKIINS